MEFQSNRGLDQINYMYKVGKYIYKKFNQNDKYLMYSHYATKNRKNSYIFTHVGPTRPFLKISLYCRIKRQFKIGVSMENM